MHREAPGATTLADPGLDVIDLAARRQEIGASQQLTALCRMPVGVGWAPISVPVREVILPIDTPGGFIAGDDDWYSPIQEGLVMAQGQCLSGAAAAHAGAL